MPKKTVTLFFLAFLLVGLLSSATLAQKPKFDLDQLARAAEQSLPLPVATNKLDRNQSRRLAQDCFNLARISAEDHRQVCVVNPSLSRAVQLLSPNEPDLTPEQRLAVRFYKSALRATEADYPTPAPLPPDSPLAKSTAAGRQAVADALKVEIIKISMQIEGASVRGSLVQRAEAEARLRTLYADLKKALGNKRHLLPADPYEFVSSNDVLDTAANSLKAEKRFYDHFDALANNGDVKITRDSLSAEIARLESLRNADKPGQFHRARDQLAEAIDEDVWNDLIKTREQRVAAEKVRVVKEWRARYPAFIIPGDNIVRLPRAQSYYSELALETIRNYLTEPTEWAKAESKLLAAYTRLRQQTGLTRTYANWFASLLSSNELEVSVAHAKSILSQPEFQLTEGRIDPRSAHQRYYAELLNRLDGELSLRRSGGKWNPPPARLPDDPGLSNLENLYKTQLTKERYAVLSTAPKELIVNVKDLHTKVATSDIDKAMKLYRDLSAQTDIAARSNRPLAKAQLDNLTKARAQTFEAFQRLDEVLDQRISEGVLRPTTESRKVKAIVGTLKAERPPPNFGGSSGGVPSAPPPDSPVPLINSSQPLVNPPPSRTTGRVRDAPYLSKLNKAQTAVLELKTSLAGVQTSPKPIGADTGRLIVRDSDLWRGGINYANKPLATEQPRLPQGQQSERLFINPATNKPWPYSDVKSLKSLKPVGGGIHFGDIARLEAPADLSEYVLSYEADSQTLVLVGPENRRYSYGPISPQELKALYRFACTDHNMVISVGWTGQAESARPTGTSSVLLNSAFVDTIVGQTLFETDSIPWKLDQDLPNGIANPFAKEFKKAEDVRRRRSIEPFLRLFEGAVKFEERPGTFWQNLFVLEDTLDSLVVSVALNTDLARAREDYLVRTRIEDHKLLLTKRGISAQQRQQIKQYIEDVERKALILNQYQHAYQGEDTTAARELLWDLTYSRMSSDDFERKWVTLWAALAKSKSPTLTAEQLAEYFHSEATTTLAMLMDEPTTILLKDNQIVLQGKMSYKYATDEIVVTPDRIIIGEKLQGETNRVRELRELTQLANRALPRLMTLYPPLEKTARYAMLTAFLRWARAKGHVLAIDFSSLASYSASDRVQTPTPDAVIRY